MIIVGQKSPSLLVLYDVIRAAITVPLHTIESNDNVVPLGNIALLLFIMSCNFHSSQISLCMNIALVVCVYD